MGIMRNDAMDERKMKSFILINIIVVLCLLVILILRCGFFSFKSSKEDRVNRVKQEDKVNVFQESDRVITNPYIGLVMDSTSENIPQPFSMVYAGVSWREMEPQKGRIDFQAFETKIRYDHWKEKGIKFVIRLYLDYPSDVKHMDIPEWVYNEIQGKGSWYDKDGQKGFSPDYNNKLLIKYHLDLIKALSERYDKDGEIAFVEIGSIGQWGEWHNSLLGGNNNFPKTNITDLYVEPYLDYFKNKILLMRRPFQIAKDNKMGLFNDSFGDDFQTNDYFLNWVNNGYEDPNIEQQNPSMKDFWTEAPSGGEFANYPGDEYLEDRSIESTINMVKNSHTSWLGPSNPGYVKLEDDKQRNLSKLLNLMGYRYTVTKSQYLDKNYPGDKLKGKISLRNSGVAPFYFEWPLYLSINYINKSIMDTFKFDYNIKKLLPGSADIDFDIPLNKSLSAGIYNMNVYLLNPETKKPEIEFANTGSEESKTCSVGETEVIMQYPYNCNDLKNNNYYNYIDYFGEKLTINSIPKNKEQSSENQCFIYRNLLNSDGYEIKLGLKNPNSNIKNYSIENNTDGNIQQIININYVDNNALKISCDKESSIIKLPANIMIKKNKDKIRIFNLTENNKEEDIFNIKCKDENSVSQIGLRVKFKEENSQYSSVIDDFSIVK
ncbi:MAG: DUF4832 domain-containing protein [Clostridiaceae bacterium]|nr:DUF4832 domain-containing protein [Clostridiaceae bacterium]